MLKIVKETIFIDLELASWYILKWLLHNLLQINSVVMRSITESKQKQRKHIEIKNNYPLLFLQQRTECMVQAWLHWLGADIWSEGPHWPQLLMSKNLTLEIDYIDESSQVKSCWLTYLSWNIKIWVPTPLTKMLWAFLLNLRWFSQDD